MGVSIILVGPRGGETNITPGWRSMMYSLMLDRFCTGGDFLFHKADIPDLRDLADNQRKGIEDPPFDYSDDIKESFEKIIAAVEKHGRAVVECSH